MSAHTRNINVYRAMDFIAVEGVRKGEPLSFADDLEMDDLYQMVPQALS